MKYLFEESLKFSIFTETNNDMKQYTTAPTIHVGILLREKITFNLYGTFITDDGTEATGSQEVTLSNGKIMYHGKDYTCLSFTAKDELNSFELMEVTIGIQFHWERKENQRFNGDLKFVIADNKIQAINIIHVEKYLTSVISSEMSATSSLELLKAHAVISRSWLLNKLEGKKTTSSIGEMTQNEEKIIRWYDHQDHKLFDVCADDHCQRYQGITKSGTLAVQEAIQATYGQVLTYNDKICDARFYKACGGATELFENCWEEVHHPYLIAIADDKEATLPNLTNEEEAEQWILAEPKAFCNTKEKSILSQVLNNYDQETPDFYRWVVDYTQEELSQIIAEKSGIDFGKIQELIPIKRGASGRIIELKVVGEKKTMIIGKELEIRKILSRSHLYSSAFIVRKEIRNGNIHFQLKGAGWGHGVGLCQIGAAVMASEGYNYKEILQHYYPNSVLSSLYEKKK